MKIVHRDCDGNLIVAMDPAEWEKVTGGRDFTLGSEVEAIDPASIRVRAERLRDAIDREFPRKP